MNPDVANFRKRLARLLLYLSLIYIGAAIASAQPKGQDITIQEFTTEPGSIPANTSSETSIRPRDYQPGFVSQDSN